jgi:C-terminal peptidase (prc)
MKRLKKIVMASSITILLGITFFGAVAFTSDDFKISKSLDVFFTLFRELDIFYVDKIDPEKLVNTGINAMLESLDPYTEYIPESEKADFDFLTTGKYGGIGALIRKNGTNAQIVEIYEGSPAQKAGIRVGDEISFINGTPVGKMEIGEVSSHLKGDPGSSVKLVLNDSYSDSIFTKVVIRERIKMPSVPYSGMVQSDVGYVRLSSFTVGCSDELRLAINDLRNKGAKKLILDLRGNPGGILDEAVKIVNFFVSKNQLVVYTHGKATQFDTKYLTSDQPIDTLMPLVLLVNSSSASASEIVSGSLQDLDRAVIVGTRTFGKGLVQTTRKLSYGGQLKVTTAKYYIPSGRCIQALDYSHRNPDGSVGHIPDSLIRAFKTKNGRTVYDGGGISPDVYLSSDTLSTICIKAYSENRFFDFANIYFRSHPTIPAPSKFVVKDTLIADFVHYLVKNKFSYKTEEEALLDRLDSLVKDDKNGGALQAKVKSLREDVSRGIPELVNKNRNDFAYFLTDEIVKRYYFQGGTYPAIFKFDSQLSKSIAIIDAPARYNKLLKR